MGAPDHSGVEVVDGPRIEHLREPLGIGEPRPRVSFTVRAPAGWRQGAYELEVHGAAGLVCSQRVESTESVLVPWIGPSLTSRERRRVRVRVHVHVHDERRTTSGSSAWSAWTDLEAGLLKPADWVARVVTAPWAQSADADAVPIRLRTTFSVSGPVRSARLYTTAHGVYEPHLNGAQVGRDVLAPGWTSYDHRLRYQTHDVTALVVEGDNTVGLVVADGWYRGRLGFHGGRRDNWGTEPGGLAQLEVELEDGRRLVIATDERWEASTGPTLAASLYDGETFDARRRDDWCAPGAGTRADGSAWSPVRLVERDPATLVAPTGPPVRCVQEVAPVGVSRTASGRHLVDFGQNLVGRLRITVDAPAGHTVTLRHAEVLQDGELCTRPLRHAAATDRYVAAGRGRETWEPSFTVHGFRYAEVEGWPDDDLASQVVARVLHSDLRRTGWFECSDPDLERLHENVVWSMRGNVLDVPTDCPQRDERLGWTGDIQVFAPTAGFLFDVTGFLGSWLRDVAADQLPDGNVPWYVPYLETDEFCSPPRPSAVWGDVAVLTPYDVWWASGDLRVVSAQLDSARAWVDLVERRAGEDRVWDGDFQLGDWLDPAAPPEDPAAALTDPALVATAYFAHAATTLAHSFALVGRDDDAKRYARLAEEVRAAFRVRFLNPDRDPAEDTQTACALAICFDLVEPDERRGVGRRLAGLVEANGHRIGTGFAGTPLVLDALTRTGHLDSAYRVLTERACPSWLYAVDMGATTIWERWDSMLPDGSVNPGEMTSFNHYALGAVAHWLHTTVGGLEATDPGWRSVRIRPQPGAELTWAKVRHDSPYGPISVSWHLSGVDLEVSVEVPSDVQAVVEVPGETRAVGPGSHVIVGRWATP